jgi:hypothetical protein
MHGSYEEGVLTVRMTAMFAEAVMQGRLLPMTSCVC